MLAAIERLQGLVTANTASPAAGAVKQELRALLDAIHAAEAELEASVLAIKTAKLTALVTTIEQRIVRIVSPTGTEPTLPAAAGTVDDRDETNDRARLAVVPPPEQPELPNPSPVATLLPPIALVRGEAAVAEVASVETSPAPHDVTGASTISEIPAAAELEAIPIRPPTPPPADMLKSIMALSEEERLALFT